jgi:hypothetical protein
MKLEYPRFWKKLLGLLRSELDQASSTMDRFFGPCLKPKLSLGVKCARVGFKPILKKARGSVTLGREINSVALEAGLSSGSGLVSVSDLGTASNPSLGPDTVSDPGSDPGTVSLTFHFLVTFVASSAAVQEKTLAN